MSDINYQEYGTGNAIVLLHGFPFNHSIWDSFGKALAENFKVFAIDLPGFGNSPSLNAPFSIDDVAGYVLEWLNEKGIINSVLIGHSLGGYVALGMIDKNPKIFTGAGLFHSTAYADSEEKKQSRLKVIDYIDKNGVNAFTSNFIEPLFADTKHPAINAVKQIATRSSAEAVKNYTLAMRSRADSSMAIKGFKNPFLFIAGEKDAGIPVATIKEQSLLAADAEVHVLEHVAHMGMFESTDETLLIVKAFAEKCFL